MIFTVRVLQPFPALGLHPGNLVMVEPGGALPINLIRPLPCNYGAIVGLLEDGVGELVTPQTSVAELARAVGWPLRHPPSLPVTTARRRLGPTPLLHRLK